MNEKWTDVKTDITRKYTGHKEAYEKMLTINCYKNIQNKATMRYHFIPIRMTKSKADTTKLWQWHRAQKVLFITGGKANGTATLKCI